MWKKNRVDRHDDVDAFLFKILNDAIGCFPNIARGFPIGRGIHQEGFATGNFDIVPGVLANPIAGLEVGFPVGWEAAIAFGETLGCLDV